MALTASNKMTNHIIEISSVLPEHKVAIAQKQFNKFITFKEELYTDLDSVSAQLLTVVDKIKTNILTRDN